MKHPFLQFEPLTGELFVLKGAKKKEYITAETSTRSTATIRTILVDVNAAVAVHLCRNISLRTLLDR